MDRNIPFLLNKYKTKQPGEIWDTKTEHKYIKEYRYKQRLFTLDCIVNERITKSRGTFQFPKQQKDRAKHLIKHLDFTGRTSEEQYIVMIIIYTKLESNNKYTFNQFLPFLTDYGIDVQTFVRFLVKLNKHHITN